MKKIILTMAIFSSFVIGSNVYAECSHDYIKEYNYSLEVTKIMDNHYFREKCNWCGDIKSTSEVNYENCSFFNNVCGLCGEKKRIKPTYNIKLSKENQDYVYQNCVKYGIIESYEPLLATIYKKSNFNESLENGAYKGLFQLNSAYDYSWLIGREDYELLNPKDNLEIGVALYNYYYKLNHKYSTSAIIALNSGMASKDMIEYKTETGITSNVESLKEIANLCVELQESGSL